MNNHTALDALVMEHVEYERRCGIAALEGTDRTVQIVRSLARIRSLIMAGRVADAMAVARSVAPEALDEARLLLKLHLHSLRELLHRAHNAQDEAGYYDAMTEGLNFCRETLAPFALNAFPEAYREFLSVMNLFVFREKSKSEKDMEQAREEVADVLVSTIRVLVGVHDSCLAYVVRYLALIHIAWRRICENRTSRHSDKSQEAPRHNEGHENSCREGEQPSNQRSTEARSLKQSHESVAGDPEREVKKKTEETQRSSEMDALIACLNISPARVEGRPIRNSSMNRNFPEADVQSLRESLNISRDDAIDSLKYAAGDPIRAFKNELSRYWLRRNVLNELVQEYCVSRGLSEDDNGKCRSEGFENIGDAEVVDRCEALKHLRVVAQKRGINELVRAATELDPSLFGKFPRLHFRVAQFNFLERLKAGDVNGAVGIARNNLGPLVEMEPDLLPALKETSLLLAYPALVSSFSFSELCTKNMLDRLMELTGACYVETRGVYQKEEHQETNQDVGSENCSNVTGSNVTDGDVCIEDKIGEEGSSSGDLMHKLSKTGDDAHSNEMQSSVIESSLKEQTAPCPLRGAIYTALGRTLKIHEPRLTRLLGVMLKSHSSWTKYSSIQDRFAQALGIIELGSYDAAAGLDKDILQGNMEEEESEMQPLKGAREIDDKKVVLLMEFLSVSRADAISIIHDNGGKTANVEEILDALFS